ncbi:MAG: GAF domain-containing protein [Rhizobacter sp.]|nr:GAF domain-containing protein [Rhizobacter sp.]
MPSRHDPARIAELQRIAILDSSPERAYDDITRLLASTLAVPITMVNLLDEARDWFKSCVGVQQTQSPRVTSFCEAFFHTESDLIVVDDTLADARFSGHPLVVGRPFVRFYAAARLKVRGQTVGTLCAYDMEPRQITSEQVEQMRIMAGAVIEQLNQRAAPA